MNHLLGKFSPNHCCLTRMRHRRLSDNLFSLSHRNIKVQTELIRRVFEVFFSKNICKLKWILSISVEWFNSGNGVWSLGDCKFHGNMVRVIKDSLVSDVHRNQLSLLCYSNQNPPILMQLCSLSYQALHSSVPNMDLLPLAPDFRSKVAEHLTMSAESNSGNWTNSEGDNSGNKVNYDWKKREHSWTIIDFKRVKNTVQSNSFVHQLPSDRNFSLEWFPRPSGTSMTLNLCVGMIVSNMRTTVPGPIRRDWCTIEEMIMRLSWHTGPHSLSATPSEHLAQDGPFEKNSFPES